MRQPTPTAQSIHGGILCWALALGLVTDLGRAAQPSCTFTAGTSSPDPGPALDTAALLFTASDQGHEQEMAADTDNKVYSLISASSQFPLHVKGLFRSIPTMHREVHNVSETAVTDIGVLWTMVAKDGSGLLVPQRLHFTQSGQVLINGLVVTEDLVGPHIALGQGVGVTVSDKPCHCTSPPATSALCRSHGEMGHGLRGAVVCCRTVEVVVPGLTLHLHRDLLVQQPHHAALSRLESSIRVLHTLTTAPAGPGRQVAAALGESEEELREMRQVAQGSGFGIHQMTLQTQWGPSTLPLGRLDQGF